MGRFYGFNGAADISGGGANIFSGMLDILYVQHQLFENFWAFQREKYTFFQKCSNIGLVAKKLMIFFRPKSNQNSFFFNPFLTKNNQKDYSNQLLPCPLFINEAN